MSTGQLTSRLRKLVMALLAFAPFNASAQASRQLVIGANIQEMASADGGGLRTDWVERFALSTVTIGVSKTRIAASSWTVGSFGGARSLPGGWVVAGQIDHGPASIDGDSSSFDKYRIELVMPRHSGWTASFSETYFDVASLAGHLLGAGLNHSSGESGSFTFDLAKSAGGDLEQRQVSFRFDYRGEPPYVSVGAAVGSSNNRIDLRLPNAIGRTRRFRQLFISLITPLDRIEVTTSLSVMRIERNRSIVVSTGIRIPLGRQE